MFGYMLWFALGMALAVISVGFQGREDAVSADPLRHRSSARSLAGGRSRSTLALIAWLPPTSSSSTETK